MKKRILAFFLAFSLCLGLGGQAFAAWEPEGELRTEYCGVDRVDPADSAARANVVLNEAEWGLYNGLKVQFAKVADSTPSDRGPPTPAWASLCPGIFRRYLSILHITGKRGGPLSFLTFSR